jgi:4-amino-4-deoxy-L-arabinose transferase-like glycosyltransferase
MFPWSGWLVLLAGGSLRKSLRRWREWNPGTVFLACWSLVPIIFFSLSDSKLAGYILPSLPPLALLLGIRVSRILEEMKEPSRWRAAMWTHLVLSGAMSIAAVYFFQKEYGGRWGIGLVLGLVIFSPAVFAFASGTHCKRAFKATAVQGVAVLIAVAQFAFPVLGAYHSTREIAHEALKLRSVGEPIVTYGFSHHSLHYYTGYQVAGKADDLESLRRFVRISPTALIVTKAAGLKEISTDKAFSIAPLYIQANFHLLRLSKK